jgi:hypothetical protein
MAVSLTTARGAASRLTARPGWWISRTARVRIGGPMGWYAIAAIVIFVIVMGVINRIEFGRFD